MAEIGALDFPFIAFYLLLSVSVCIHASPILLLLCLNPLTPMNDQDRISPYNINRISSRQVMKINKISMRGLFVDPIPNSQTNIIRIAW